MHNLILPIHVFHECPFFYLRKLVICLDILPIFAISHLYIILYVKLIREGRCHFVSYNKPANKKTATVIHPICKKKEERLIKAPFQT